MPTLVWDLASRTDHEIVTENTESLLWLAAEGAVIVGRDATKILQREPQAPPRETHRSIRSRVAYASATTEFSLEQARRRQERGDRVRADLARRRCWIRRGQGCSTSPSTRPPSPTPAADLIVAAFRNAVEFPPRAKDPAGRPPRGPCACGGSVLQDG